MALESHWNEPRKGSLALLLLFVCFINETKNAKSGVLCPLETRIENDSWYKMAVSVTKDRAGIANAREV